MNQDGFGGFKLSFKIDFVSTIHADNFPNPHTAGDVVRILEIRIKKCLEPLGRKKGLGRRLKTDLL